MPRMRPALVILTFCLGLLAAEPATQPASKPVAFDVHNGYFVSNQFEPKEPSSFAVITDQKAFDRIFGVGVVWADKSHRLPEKSFDSKTVVAVIKRGETFWQFTVQDVQAGQGVLTIRYTATAEPQDSAEFACPLIVSVPKGSYTSVQFIENEKLVKAIGGATSRPSTEPATQAVVASDEAVWKAVRAALQTGDEKPASNPTTTSQPASQPDAPGDHVRTLELDGNTRTYIVHVPPKYDAKKPTPVLVNIHGALASAQIQAIFSGMNRKADTAGFVVVYPNGMGTTFNAWAKPASTGRPADDVKFVAKILDDVATVINVDSKRVYATGMSNGGMMCYRLAAELSDRIAAIAPVAGTLCIDKPSPKRPVPVIHFHGTADTLVPFNGPDQRTPKFITMKSVEDTVLTWVKLDGCPEKPETTKLDDTAKDGTTVTRKVYGPGKDGAEVVLYVIEGGGHTWPGQSTIFGFLGKSTKNIVANDLIWEFFEKHPMK